MTQKNWRLWVLWFVRPLIQRELIRILTEKETFSDSHHSDTDCGWQLLTEIEHLREPKR